MAPKRGKGARGSGAGELLEEARKLKQQAERRNSGVSSQPLLMRSAEMFEQAIQQQGTQLDRDDCLFDLGDVLFLLAKSIANSVPSLASPLKGNTTKARAQELKLEAFARAAPIFTKSFEIFERIQSIEIKPEALANSASVLCELAEVLLELPESQGGGAGIAMKLCGDAHERYCAAISSSPDDLDVHANMAECYVRRAELVLDCPCSSQAWNRAQPLYDSALEVFRYVCSVADTRKGDDLPALFALWAAGLASKAEHLPDYLEAMNLYETAREKLHSAAKLNPTRIDTFNALGDLYISEYERMPDEPASLDKRYVCMLSAIDTFSTALRINSSDMDALLGIAEAHRLASRSSRLLGNAQASHEHAAQSATYHMRCIERLKSDEHDKDFPRQCDILYNLACVAAHCGREPDAAAAMSLLIQAGAVTAAEILEDPDFETSKSSAWFGSILGSFHRRQPQSV